MKIKSLLTIVAAIISASASARAALTYHYTGYVAAGPPGIKVTHIETGTQSPFLGFPQLQVSTTLTVDPDNLTARFTGSSTGMAATVSYTTGISTQQVGFTAPQFPNPPQPVFADGFATITVTVNLNPGSFDTGVDPLVWNGTTYSFGRGSIGAFQGQLAITVATTSNGQTNSNFYNLDFLAYYNTSGELNLSNYPNNVTTDLSIYTDLSLWNYFAAAPNGFVSSFHMVPEPSSSMLFAAGALCALLHRKRY